MPAVDADRLRLECIQQRPGILEVSRIKPFREPSVHVPKHLPCFGSLPLTLPETGEAGGGS